MNKTAGKVEFVPSERDDLVAALRLAERELTAVENGSTGGIPNAVIALIPEALEAVRTVLAKYAS